jgi:antitoxin VapB
MTLSIRNPEAERLARRLAEIDGTSLTGAVVRALDEAIAARLAKESPHETAKRILQKHGLSFVEGRKPVPAAAFRELDRDPWD